MVEQYHQGQLASPVVGTPGPDLSMGKALEHAAEISQQMSQQAGQVRLQMLHDSQQMFTHAAAQFQTLRAQQVAVNNAQKRQALQEGIANAKYGASAALKDLSNDIQEKYIADPAAGIEAGKQQVDQIIQGFIPKDLQGKGANSAQASMYNRALFAEKAQFLEGLSTWHRQQDIANSTGKFTSTVASSLLNMQQSNNTQDFLKSRQELMDYGHATATTPERVLGIQQALKTGAVDFAQGIALTNPNEIESALIVAKPYLTNEQIGKIRNQAAGTVKQQAVAALDQQKLQNDLKETVFEGELTSKLKGALQQANTAMPGPNDIQTLRNAARQISGMGQTFDGQIENVERQLKMQPENPLLVSQLGSLVKQKKQAETAATQLLDKADGAAFKIQQRNEIAARRAEAEAHRQFAASITAQLRTNEAQNAAERAQLDLELANLKGEGKSAPPQKIGTSNGYQSVQNFPGLQVPGNLDLKNRPIVNNPDGSFSTERSMSFNDGQNEVLIPTVFNGAQHSDQEAIAQYRKTGEHMGKFATGDIAAANQYAQKLHSRQILVNGQPYTGADNVDRLAAFSRAKLNEANKTRADLDKAQQALAANPQDRMAAAQVRALSSRLSALAHVSTSADNAVETVHNRTAADERSKALAEAKLHQVAGVPLYTTLLQRAQTPFPLHTDHGKVKIDGVNLKEATDRLNQLDGALVDISQSGMLTKEQMQTVKNTLEDRRQKLNTWANQQGFVGNLFQVFQGVNDAYNKPISDMEKRGLALPGTPQYHQVLQRYKANLDAAQAAVYSAHQDPKEAVRYLSEKSQMIADKAWQATLQGKGGVQ